MESVHRMAVLYRRIADRAAPGTIAACVVVLDAVRTSARHRQAAPTAAVDAVPRGATCCIIFGGPRTQGLVLPYYADGRQGPAINTVGMARGRLRLHLPGE